jgi:hypothetical protein
VITETPKRGPVFQLGTRGKLMNEFFGEDKSRFWFAVQISDKTVLGGV